MSDPDRIHDTEPTGCPLATDEAPDADADEATEPNDPSRGELAAASSEHDTDDFLRWLPTLALGHRRRAELVERASSDGADFAAYACEGRPAAASGPARLEPAVNVQATPPRARPVGSRDAEREAPTILLRARSPRRGWRRIGWAALGVAAAAAALAAWAEGPGATEKASRRGEAVATAPLPIGRAPTPPVEAAQSAAPPRAPLQASPVEGAPTAADRSALPSRAPVPDAARKRDSVGAPRTVASPARRGAAPPAAAPTVPAKDQYFEAP